jgi:hypothetical protein
MQVLQPVQLVEGDTEVAGERQDECRQERVWVDLCYVSGVLEIEGFVPTWSLMS